MAGDRARQAESGAKLQRNQASIFILAVLLTLPAAAQPDVDNDTLKSASRPRFEVVDGDTVTFGRQRVRLFGIDAPEKDQTCDEGQWRPGPLAKKALGAFIAGRPVTCRQVDNNQTTQPAVAQCFAGDDDLQAMMVLAGWAWAFGKYSDRYAPEERDAVARKVGVHAHRCIPPWEWRARVKGGG